MGATQVLWLGWALVCVVVVVLMALTIVRRQPARPTRVVRAAWLMGAMSSGTMLISIDAMVVDKIPNATVMDLGAVAVTGVLTGAFLVLGLKPASNSGVN